MYHMAWHNNGWCVSFYFTQEFSLNFVSMITSLLSCNLILWSRNKLGSLQVKKVLSDCPMGQVLFGLSCWKINKAFGLAHNGFPSWKIHFLLHRASWHALVSWTSQNLQNWCLSLGCSHLSDQEAWSCFYVLSNSTCNPMFCTFDVKLICLRTENKYKILAKRQFEGV